MLIDLFVTVTCPAHLGMKPSAGDVLVRILVQSLLLAAARVACGILIECFLFTHRAPFNGPFHVTVIYMQVITIGYDG